MQGQESDSSTTSSRKYLTAHRIFDLQSGHIISAQVNLSKNTLTHTCTHTRKHTHADIHTCTHCMFTVLILKHMQYTRYIGELFKKRTMPLLQRYA